MHLDLQRGVFYQEHTLTDPFLSFTKKFSIPTQLHKDRGVCVLCLCLWYCQAWLWLGLTSGRNRCLRAQASPRAQLHCVRSRWVASEVEHPCGCLGGIMREAQKCPSGPHIPCLQLPCLWPLLFRHCFHQAGTEMQMCDMAAVFCHDHINMDTLARWTGAQWGSGGTCISKFSFVSLAWRNENVLERGMVAWRSGGTGQLGVSLLHVGMVGAKVPPSLTSLIVPTSALTPRAHWGARGKGLLGRRLMRLERE